MFSVWNKISNFALNKSVHILSIIGLLSLIGYNGDIDPSAGHTDPSV